MCNLVSIKLLKLLFLLNKVYQKLGSIHSYPHVWASGVGSSRTIYGTQSCPSSSEMSGHLWCCFVCTNYTAMLWRVGRRPGLCRLASVLPLIGSTTREFFISLLFGIGVYVLSINWHSFILLLKKVGAATLGGSHLHPSVQGLQPHNTNL